MEYMKHKSWGVQYDLCIEYDVSMKTGLLLHLYFLTKGIHVPFADLTIILPEYHHGANKAFVDRINIPAAEDLIRRYKLGKPTGRIGYSEYGDYPEYEFDFQEVNRYCVNPEMGMEEGR